MGGVQAADATLADLVEYRILQYISSMCAGPEETRQHLARILASAGFAHAPRLKEFLRYVVDEQLAGRASALKEYSIGVTVCGRGRDFDPKADPIVRVDANRLRGRLDAYYAAEGANDALRVELPKGSYVPIIRYREAVSSTLLGSISLAVLPFVNLSAEAAREYFGDGLTEELIHSLAQISGIRVIARSSAFALKNRTTDAREAGRQLGVTHIVEGSVRFSGESLRVTAQLIDVASGTLLWSERFQRQWADVFDVQDEIVAAISDALRLRLTSGDSSRMFQRSTVHPEAYAEYLRGRYHWNQRTSESLLLSMQCYRSALSLDPGFALAWCGITDTLVVQAVNEHAPAKTLLPAAIEASRRALDLAPGLPEAHCSRGIVRAIFEWSWREGEQLMAHGANLDPGSATAHYLHAVIGLQPLGRMREAVMALERALRLDPVSALLHRDMAILQFMQNNFDGALAFLHRAQTLDPSFVGGHYWVARAMLGSGRPRDAVAALQRRVAATNPSTRLLATLAGAHRAAGDTIAAADMETRLLSQAAEARVPPFDLAILHLGRGDIARALYHLSQAVDEHSAALYQLNIDPAFSRLRGTPGFETLLGKVGFGDRDNPS